MQEDHFQYLPYYRSLSDITTAYAISFDIFILLACYIPSVVAVSIAPWLLNLFHQAPHANVGVVVISSNKQNARMVYETQKIMSMNN
jgi:hypothetical protein